MATKKIKDLGLGKVVKQPTRKVKHEPDVPEAVRNYKAPNPLKTVSVSKGRMSAKTQLNTQQVKRKELTEEEYFNILNMPRGRFTNRVKAISKRKKTK